MRSPGEAEDRWQCQEGREVVRRVGRGNGELVMKSGQAVDLMWVDHSELIIPQRDRSTRLAACMPTVQYLPTKAGTSWHSILRIHSIHLGLCT